MKKILVLIGGSGSGKTRVAQELEQKGFHRFVTTTTRPMREDEINHESYHFVTKEEFEQLDKLEKNEYVGNWYGLSRAEVENKLHSDYSQFVVVMEVNGAEAMKRIYGDMVQVVFLTIPPYEMEARLRQRGGDESHIQERLQQAHDYHEFTKPEVADLEVFNLDLEKAINQIIEFTKKKPTN